LALEAAELAQQHPTKLCRIRNQVIIFIELDRIHLAVHKVIFDSTGSLGQRTMYGSTLAFTFPQSNHPLIFRMGSVR